MRTLPIRVPPIDGEAMDSWLEAIAHRTRTAFGDLLSAVGLVQHDGRSAVPWTVLLTPEEAEVLSVVTGVAWPVLEAMTLAHYSGRAVRVEPGAGVISRAFPWGRASGSRFCPECLGETGGR